MKFRISDEHAYGERRINLYNTEMPMQEGQFAMQLVERFGLIAAKPQGEDTAGRQAGELLTPSEVVSRAFDISNLTFDELRARGLMLQLPDLNEINAERDAEIRAKTEAKREKASA